MLKYILLGLSATALALLLTPWVRQLAFRLGAVDEPGGRRLHQGRIPRLGGVAVLAAFLGALAVGALVDVLFVDVFFGHGWAWCWVLVGALIVSTVGAADDIWGLGPIPKLLFQILAGMIVFNSGHGIHTITNPLTGIGIELHWLAAPLTLLWVVGITNAFNLIDGLDGLAAGVALIAATTLFVVSLMAGHVEVALIAVTLAGALAGFLCYNFNPASIFLGDSGSLFLGYLLSVLSIQASLKGTTAVVVVVPLLALGLPIMDTLLAMLRRLIGALHVVQPDEEHNEYRFLVVGSASIFHADRNHIHHRLLAMGLTHRRTVLLLYGVCISLSVLAFLAVSLSGFHNAILVAVVAVGSYLGIRKLGYQEVNVLGRGTLLPLLELPVLNRRVVRVLVDIAFISIAYLGSLLAVNGGSLDAPSRAYYLESVIILVAVKLATFAFTGTYKRAFRYSDATDILALIKTLFMAEAAAGLLITLLCGLPPHPTAVPLLDFYFNASLSFAARMAFTVLETLASERPDDEAKARPMLIYGAGKAGAAVLREVARNPALQYRPVGFLDDFATLWGRRINGVPVMGGVDQLAGIIERDGVSDVILSTAKIPLRRIEAAAATCRPYGIQLRRFQVILEPVEDSAQLIKKTGAKGH
jgi:UDP-GlcNAc:undecaprenyl-phosphate GlcNAc-1-phosphate transferase